MTGDLWRRAAAAAARWHRGQTRRDNKTPYVSHVYRVAMTVRHTFGCDDEECLAIALLHDVIEDTPADYDDVFEAFGEVVAKGVAALTKDMRLPEEEREPAYDAQLAEAGWRAKMVKLADTVDNLLDAKAPMPRGIDKCRRAIAIAERHDGDELGAALEATRRVLSIATGS